jgi:hypothetical protein
LRCPIGDQENAPTSPFGTEGVEQKFDYWTVYSSGHGVFEVISAESYYKGEGGSGGWLGFPVSETEISSDCWHRQQFEGGIIYFCRVPSGGDYKPVEFAVRREVAAVFPSNLEWHPVSKEVSVASSLGTRGTVQHFEIGLDEDTCETAVYSPAGESHPLVVVREVWGYYTKLGAEKSWLGFPATQGVSLPSGVVRQRFEGGTIYLRSKSGPVAVRKAVDDYIFQDRDLLKRLGFPVSEEQPVGEDGSGCIQYFQNGVVTLRDGKYEVWVRPDPKSEPPVEQDFYADVARFARQLGMED